MSTSATTDAFVFSIRFTDGRRDIKDLIVEKDERVKALKLRVKALCPELSDKKLRFILRGRVLLDSWLVMDVVHKLNIASEPEEPVVVTGKGKARETFAKTVWIHCSVSEQAGDDETSVNDNGGQQITPLTGLDRLLDTGFSQEEINQIRSELRLNAGTDDTTLLEEQWLDPTPQMTPSTSTYIPLLVGTSIGFFVPYLPLFFFRSSLFSRPVQLSIILGMAVNIAFGLIRSFS